MDTKIWNGRVPQISDDAGTVDANGNIISISGHPVAFGKICIRDEEITRAKIAGWRLVRTVDDKLWFAERTQFERISFKSATEEK